MADRDLRSPSTVDGYHRHWVEQVRRGLRFTPAERLAWLETTMEELRGWVGLARRGVTSGSAKPGDPRT